MVKKKGGREMNPMDSHRKAERAKQLARNKKERQMQREAMSHLDDPAYLRQQLKEILDEEELGPLNPTQRSRKKTLQKAYDAAIRRRMEIEAKKKQDLERKDEAGAPAVPVGQIPLPPLPQGPPPVAAPMLHIPLPTGVPPGMAIPPPVAPPPMAASQERKFGASVHDMEMDAQDNTSKASKRTAPVISAKSTVVPLPKAQHDKSLTSLVPASVQASRPSAKKPQGKKPEISRSSFGLVPRSVSKQTGKEPSADIPDNFDDFMKSLKNM